MHNQPFEQFINIKSAQQEAEFQLIVFNKGYSFFRLILEGVRQKVKQFSDEDIENVLGMMEKAKHIFPHPGKISPSWLNIWEELDEIVSYKIKLLQAVPPHERTGVWQIVMDNPYTNQEIVCYPNLTFIDAAYLYGFFRPGLERNEYIEIQKVERLLTEFGS